MFVDHPYPRKRLPVTGCFPRIDVYGNVFVSSFPSYGSARHITYVLLGPTEMSEMRAANIRIFSYGVRYLSDNIKVKTGQTGNSKKLRAFSWYGKKTAGDYFQKLVNSVKSCIFKSRSAFK
jgi:uncharacterized protein YycO